MVIVKLKPRQVRVGVKCQCEMCGAPRSVPLRSPSRAFRLPRCRCGGKLLRIGKPPSLPPIQFDVPNFGIDEWREQD